METITLGSAELERLLQRAARIGGEQAGNIVFENLAVYNKEDACKRLSMSMPTLNKRIAERKIRAVDGKITGAEIRRYLNQV